MKVIHIVPRIDTYSAGPSYTVPALSLALRSLSTDSVVATVGPSILKNSSILEFKSGPFPFGSSSTELKNWLVSQCKSAENIIIHSHSIWLFPNVYPLLCRNFPNVRIVLSPRGTLSESALRFSRLKKTIFWHLFQKKVFKAAAGFHATSHDEACDIRRLGFNQKILISPNGINIPEIKVVPPKRRQILYLARIHPKKGVEDLIAAWSLLGKQLDGWDLIIAGPTNNYSKNLASQIKYNSIKNVRFVGEVVGDEKNILFMQSMLYVLPTYSENFGVSIAEAMSHGLPVIVGQGAPWEDIKRHDLGWWIPNGVQPLTKAIKAAISTDFVELSAKGSRAKSYVEQHYSWPNVANEISLFYNNLFSS